MMNNKFTNKLIQLRSSFLKLVVNDPESIIRNFKPNVQTMIFKNYKLSSLLAIIALFSFSNLQAQLLEDGRYTSTQKYIEVSMTFAEENLQNIKNPREKQLAWEVQAFYKSRNSEPAWINTDGTLKAMAYQMPAYVSDMMHPSYFNFQKLFNLFEKYNAIVASGAVPSSRMLGKMDLFLTQTYLAVGMVNLNGYVLPEELTGIEWYLPSRTANVVNNLTKAVIEGDVKTQLDNLLPKDDAYPKLVAHLDRYKEIKKNGGWPMVSSEILDVEMGDTSAVVSTLRKRLGITEDLATIFLTGEVYDENLVEAVTFYQKRNGLATDGKVGKNTLDNLNISVEERIRQLELNIERYKWLPDHKGRKYIWVNIPEYMLRMYEDGQLVKENVVVTGAKRHQTPCFQSKLTNIVFNPYWNVPISIAKNEIGPKVSQDAQYLLDKNYEVVNGWGTNKALDSTENIDWNDKSSYNKIRFRQKPGPGNALGIVKFNMPNKWSIYLHDTPSKSKFKMAHRAYSHGCVRVSDPTSLAVSVLENDPRWSENDVQKAIATGKTQRIQIVEEIDVYLVYMTAWVDDNGQLQLREDVYGRDKKLDAKLQNI
ncbi:L,D-transpeptidase family protein [Flammeovirgaceae bacterium SG7u.111]|nr:L,D-transpeptidase family protein [Flammeovirgaceae bacterium SG7u.132]WPO34400.1 L,D-transpeptidase family protein [Flammeovirgaceae bacterium SG7u.111]